MLFENHFSLVPPSNLSKTILDKLQNAYSNVGSLVGDVLSVILHQFSDFTGYQIVFTMKIYLLFRYKQSYFPDTVCDHSSVLKEAVDYLERLFPSKLVLESDTYLEELNKCNLTASNINEVIDHWHVFYSPYRIMRPENNRTILSTLFKHHAGTIYDPLSKFSFDEFFSVAGNSYYVTIPDKTVWSTQVLLCYILGQSFENCKQSSDLYEVKKFDYMFSTVIDSPDRKNDEYKLIFNSFRKNLKKDGTCIFALDRSFLYSSSSKSLREEFSGYLHTVIEIGERYNRFGTRPNGDRLSIVVLRNNLGYRPVEMAYLNNSSFDELRNLFSNSTPLETASFSDGTYLSVKREDILQNEGCFWTPFFYLVKQEVESKRSEGESYSCLADILTPSYAQSITRDSISHRFNPVAYPKNSSFQMSEVDSNGFGAKRLFGQVTEPSIFIPSMDDFSRASYAMASVDKPVHINRIKNFFTFDTEKYDPEYLVYSIRKFASGKGQNRVSGCPLDLIYIPTPDIHEQRRLMDELRSQDEEYRRKEALSKQEIQKLEEKFKMTLKVKRHSLKNKLEVISSEVDFEYQSILMGKTDVNKETVESLLKKVLYNLDDFLKKINLELDSTINFGNPETIELHDYFTEYTDKNRQNAIMQNFELRYIPLSISHLPNDVENEDTFSRLPVSVNQNDLDNLVNNILTNAVKHGFVEKRSQGYYFQIETSYDEESGRVIIDFINNGKPMPESINETNYSTTGFTAGGVNEGDGLGGVYVHDFVKHYQGTFSIHSDNTENGILTRIRVELPLKYDEYDA